MDDLKVVGVAIRRDAEGRYSLVDLYKASGSNPKDKPSHWLSCKSTKALVEELNREINKAGIPAYSSKQESDAAKLNKEENKALISAYSTTQKSGAFVVRELVYVYAMWISPAFNLRVIRAFDEMVNREFVQPSLKAERYWFGKRPFWPEIRERVMLGQSFKMIAEAMGRSPASVRNAVSRMIEVGIIQPPRAVQALTGTAKKAVIRYSHKFLSSDRQPMLPGFGVVTQ